MAQMQNNLKAASQNGQLMQANQMERSGSNMDNRSGSPGSGDAPSPKRQRIDGGMQQMAQGRPGQPGQMQQGTQVGPPPDHPHPSSAAALDETRQMLRSRGINPEDLPRNTISNLATQTTNVQTQSVDAYSQSMQRSIQAAMGNIPKQDSNGAQKGLAPNMGPGGAQGSPMSQPGMDGANGEFYAATNGGARMPMQGQAAAAAAAAGQNSNGNHALQDYQMQLMLLEQQNKKRLLMARQEQDSMSSHPAGVGPNGSFQPGMSRPSPPPRPMAARRGVMLRSESHAYVAADVGSPSAGQMMVDPGSIPPQLRGQMMMTTGPNGQQVMRPPSSHPGLTPQQLEMMRQQGMPIPNGQFAPGQQPPPGMMPGQQPGQPGPQGTPRQANTNMPPPPAPAAGTGPSSPSQQPAPPTPSTTNKPKGGNKKETAKKVSLITSTQSTL